MDFKFTGFVCFLLLLFSLAQPVLAEDTSEDKSNLEDDSNSEDKRTSYVSVGLDKGLTIDLLNQVPDPVKPGISLKSGFQSRTWDIRI